MALLTTQSSTAPPKSRATTSPTSWHRLGCQDMIADARYLVRLERRGGAGGIVRPHQLTGRGGGEEAGPPAGLGPLEWDPWKSPPVNPRQGRRKARLEPLPLSVFVAFPIPPGFWDPAGGAS